MIVDDAVKVMEAWASPTLMDSCDNGGLLYGSVINKVRGILMTLDVTEDVVKYAIDKGLNLIISHHPIIFKPIKKLSLDSYNGRMASHIIKNDLNIYCSHTNLDIALGGVSDALAEKLGVNQCIPLIDFEKEKRDSRIGYGRVGNIQPIYIEQFAKLIKKRLGLDFVKVYGRMESEVTRVAVCGGSGGDLIEEAAKSGAQVFVTGDVKYHEAQFAGELGMVIIDATHYHSERPILDVMLSRLSVAADEKIKLVIYPELPFAETYY